VAAGLIPDNFRVADHLPRVCRGAAAACDLRQRDQVLQSLTDE